MSRSLAELTDLLDAWSEGDPLALEQLIPIVYDKLHEIARREFRREGRDHTLQPTAIVNEVYLRFKGQRKVQWYSRSEFFGVAAQQVRRILVDHARRRRRKKRGGDVRRVPLDEELDWVESESPDYLELDAALEKLAELSPRQSKIVELHIFAGLGHAEIAAILGVSRTTVCRDWQTARLWLKRQLSSK